MDGGWSRGDSAGQQGVTGQGDEGGEARKLFGGIQRPTRILDPENSLENYFHFSRSREILVLVSKHEIDRKQFSFSSGNLK